MNLETRKRSGDVSQLRRGQGTAAKPSAMNGSVSGTRWWAEGALAELMQVLESLSDNLHVAPFRTLSKQVGGVAIVNLDGYFARYNPACCAIFGYPEGELRDLRFTELIHPGDRVRNLVGIERLLVEEVPHFEIDNRYVRKNGELVWGHQFVTLLRDHAGEPKHLVAFVTDVTEGRKTEPELREAQERLHRRNVELEQAVHKQTMELRQAQARLGVLASELKLAAQRERKRLATELHDHLQQLLVLGKLKLGQCKRVVGGVPGCDTALQEVDDVLSEALAYSRTLVAERSRLVMHDDDLVAGLRRLGESMKKYDQIVTVVAPEGPGLTLPEDERVVLVQSVRELLINSAKYAGTGQARLTMTLQEGTLRVTVSDEGKGFSGAASETPGGAISSRYGLSSIQERMRALGGWVTIDSAPGQGTTATLVCPLTGGAVDRQLRRRYSELAPST